MAITQETTIGQIVAQKPSFSKVFEKYGIDYCCGGKRPLGEVCEEKALGFDEVVRELERAEQAGAAAGERDWNTASLCELADHIEATHHAYLREALPRLSDLTAKVASVHGPNKPHMVTVKEVFDGLRMELEMHMMKEEQILFPLLRQLETSGVMQHFHCGSVQNPIAVMEDEHDAAGRALQEMNRLTNGYTPPEDACNTFLALLDGLAELEADLHLHIHKENNILFPRGAQLEAELAK